MVLKQHSTPMDTNFMTAGEALPAMNNSRTMLTAVLEGPNRVRLVRQPVPSLADDELLVRVTACGICSSDLMDWYVEQKAPFVFGHEPVGVVVGVGRRVQGFVVGDRVFIHHHAPCGVCDLCRKGHVVHCPTWRRPALEPGGMSEFVRVLGHGVKGDTLLLPPKVTDLDATLIEPVACAVKALKKGRLQSGEHVLIVGLGFMGQVLGKLVRHAGAGRVEGSDPLACRRERAESWADAVYDPSTLTRDLLQSGGSAGPDLIIVTPPAPAAIQQAIECAGPAARVLLFAPTPVQDLVPLPLGHMFFRETEIIPSYSAGPDETLAALQLIEDRVIQASDLVTHVFPFSDIVHHYGRLKDPHVLKAVVTMGGE